MLSGVVAVAGALVAVIVATLAAVADVAIGRMTPTRVQAIADDGRPGARRLGALVDNPDRWRHTLQLVVVAAVVTQAAVVAGVARDLWGGPGLAGAMVVDAAVVFVAVWVVPTVLGARHAERVALASALWVGALVAVVPLRAVAGGLAALGRVFVPGRASTGDDWVSEEELLAVAEAAVAGDVIEAEERDLIASIIDFGDTVVREVMVPRPDMVTVPVHLRVPDAMEVAILHGYSRLPATEGDIDDIVGLVYAKDLMRAERDGRSDAEVSSLLRAARYIPETKRIAELLKEMQAEQFHMAVAVDEYGGTAGLVTIEDIIEELVGEIVDEYDREEPLVEPAVGGRVRVNARIAIDELNEVLGSSLPEGDWDTAGGLLFHLLGRVPQVGDWASSDGWVLTADRVQGRRINRIVVQPSSCALRWANDTPSGTDGPAELSGSRTPFGGDR